MIINSKRPVFMPLLACSFLSFGVGMAVAALSLPCFGNRLKAIRWEALGIYTLLSSLGV